MFSYLTVSVVIPARNAQTTIIDTLESLANQDYIGNIEVIIADGSDSHKVLDIDYKKYPQVSIISNPDKTIPSGLNRAIETANGDVIVRCDASTILPIDYISKSVKLLGELASSGVACCVGGMAVPTGRGLFGRAVARAVVSPFVSGNSRYKVGGKSGPVDTVYLGVFFKNTWKELGGYNESLEANEDYEFNWRVRQNGGIVWFDSSIQSTYKTRDNPIALAKQGFNYGRWKSTMLLKNPKSVKIRHLCSPIILIGTLASILYAIITGNMSFLIIWPLLYLLVSLIETMRSLKKLDRTLLLFPIVISIMHISWASGFFFPRKRNLKKM